MGWSSQQYFERVHTAVGSHSHLLLPPLPARITDHVIVRVEWPVYGADRRWMNEDIGSSHRDRGGLRACRLYATQGTRAWKRNKNSICATSANQQATSRMRLLFCSLAPAPAGSDLKHRLRLAVVGTLAIFQLHVAKGKGEMRNVS